MSAVDAPPGISFAGRAAGELVARRWRKRLARVSLYYVVLMSVAIAAVVRRMMHKQGVEVFFAGILLFLCVGALGYAVRAARLRIDEDGVRWGWDALGFRMQPHRIARVRVFSNAVAFQPKRGSTWYLSERDWMGFGEVVPALKRARLPYQRELGRAPLAARLQSYGLVLDLLLLANAAGATFTLLMAFAAR